MKKTRKHTLKLALGSGLHDLLDLVVGDWLLGAAGQVDNGDVGCGHTHGHTSQLSVELWDDLSDGLGGTGAAGDDVLGSGTATTPVLAGGTVDGLLGGSVGVDGGHQTFLETPVLVDDLGEGSKAIGGAGSVGENLDIGSVLLLIDTHYEHGSIRRGSRDDDLLGTSLQVSAGLLGGGEDTGGLDDVVSSSLGPLDVGWVTLSVELDVLAANDEATLVVLDIIFELAVLRVIF